MIRFLHPTLFSLILFTHSVSFAQFADRYAHTGYVHTGYIHTGYVHTGYVHTGYVHTGYVHTGYVHTGYVAGSSSVTLEEAGFRLILSPAGSTLIDLSIEKQPDTPIELRLRDDNRYTLFSCRSRTDAPLFVRRIDLRELDNGTYRLDIQIGKSHTTRKLRLISLSNTEQMVLLEN